MRLLIVEDEAALRAQLARRLRRAGYVVNLAADGEAGLFFAREYPIDLAIIDLGLPRCCGLTMIQQLRAEGARFPILILTARSSWREKVQGLEAGADDYLVKPFHFEELRARITALIRRAAGQPSPVLRCGAIALDTRARGVQVAERKPALTTFEYRLLHYLMLHAGKVVSKTELTEHLYDDERAHDSNVLEVLVGRVRRKLDPDGQLNPIETVRGSGYRFMAA